MTRDPDRSESNAAVQPRTLTPREWVSRANEKYGPLLRSVGLVCEVAVSDKISRNAAHALGTLWVQDRENAVRMMRLHPSAVLLALTGAAVHGYEAGAFWVPFAERCGVAIEGPDQAKWGEAFLTGLDRFGLPTFPGFPKKNLGPILMHAGIPNYCLPDYFRALDAATRAVGGDAQDVTDWIIKQADSALVNVDRPVVRFIEHAGEYAADFVGRTLDLIHNLVADVPISQSGLRMEIQDAAGSYVENLGGNHRQRSSFRSRRVARPTVILDPYSGELTLKLPPLPRIDFDFTWRVSIDGTERRVRPSEDLGGRSIGAQEASTPLDRPIRRISVSADVLDVDHTIELFSDDEPLIAFDQDGGLLSLRRALPAGPVWLLFHSPDRSSEPDFASGIRLEEGSPSGWLGWRLALVDLDGIQRIRLTPKGRTYEVQAQSRARLDDGRVTWLRSAGLSVMTTRPTAHLPSGLATKWTITVTDEQTGNESLTVIETDETHGPRNVDPFISFTLPVVGVYDIKVSGPLGRGARRRFAVAEGLTIEPGTVWRPLVNGGLAPVDLLFQGEGLSVNPAQVHIDASSDSAEVAITCKSNYLTCLARPPAMSVTTEHDGRPKPWRNGLVRVRTEELAATRLLIRVPPGASCSPLFVFDTNRELQEIRASQGATSEFQSFSLASMADTAAAHPVTDLYVDINGHRCRVARVQPTQIARGAEIDGESIQLVDFTGGSVAVRVWSVLEPWHGRWDADVPPEGLVSLPHHLIGRGPLAVTWERHDPWEWSDPPAFPPEGEFRILDAPLDQSAASPAAIALHSGTVSVEPVSAAAAWSLLGMRFHVAQRFLPWRTVHALTADLAATPSHALAALADAALGSDEAVRALIQSRVAWQPLTMSADLSDYELTGILRRAPLAGALLTIPRLADPNAPQVLPRAWAECTAQFGDAFLHIITGRPDPAINQGGMKEGKVLDHMPDDIRLPLLASFRCVPKAVLDGDARRLVAVNLFDNRHHQAFKEAGRDARQDITESIRLCEDWGLTEGQSLIAHRDDPAGKGGWVALSAASAAFAIMARLASRGDDRASSYLDRRWGSWMELARGAPDHVTLDLILAEAMVAAHTAESLPTVRGDEGDLNDSAA
jgi:hypothetical protein